jgi:hypothetical protein
MQPSTSGQAATTVGQQETQSPPHKHRSHSTPPPEYRNFSLIADHNLDQAAAASPWQEAEPGSETAARLRGAAAAGPAHVLLNQHVEDTIEDAPGNMSPHVIELTSRSKKVQGTAGLGSTGGGFFRGCFSDRRPPPRPRTQPAAPQQTGGAAQPRVSIRLGPEPGKHPGHSGDSSAPSDVEMGQQQPSAPSSVASDPGGRRRSRRRRRPPQEYWRVAPPHPSEGSISSSSEPEDPPSHQRAAILAADSPPTRAPSGRGRQQERGRPAQK